MNRYMKGCLGALLCAGSIAFSPAVYADESSDAILQVLIKKGVVTSEEVEEMKSSIRSSSVSQAKAEVEQEQGLENRVANLESNIPKWLKSTKFKADLRLRNEVIAERPAGTGSLTRQRIRLRFGFENQIHEKVKFAFGLATGSSADHTSTNQTLDNAFDKKQIWVDYAYASYSPWKCLTLTGGKFGNPFFGTDMLWDSDLNFEGVYAKHTTDFDLSGVPSQFYLTGGYFPIEQVSYNAGPARSISLYAAQAGLNMKFEGVDVKSGIAYYNFGGLRGNSQAITWRRGTNNAYAKDYKVLVPTLMVNFKDVVGNVDLGLLGEYSDNSGGTATVNNAYRYGAWIGDQKAKKEGQWKVVGQYTEIQRDATIDAFPDADFISGRTNARGWEFIGDYALFDNVILSADYYSTKEITTGLTHKVIQTDFIVMF